MSERSAQKIFAHSRWLCSGVAGAVLALVVAVGVPTYSQARETCSIRDRFIEARILPKALKYWNRFSKYPDEGAEKPDGTVVFKSVVFKSGYLPKDNNVARPVKPAASTEATFGLTPC